jgi:hypothetical protein
MTRRRKMYDERPDLPRIGVDALAEFSEETLERARRAVALQTIRGLPRGEVPEILAMLGLTRADATMDPD